MSDLDDLVNLHQLVQEKLSDPDLYAPGTRDYFANHIHNEGITIGAFDADYLIAYSLLRFPNYSGDNLGRDVGLQDSDLPTVAHLQESAVHPEYRGSGLHYELTARRIAVATALGYRRMFTTVSPKNTPSLKTDLKHGFVVIKLTQKYGGRDRFILGKDLDWPRPDQR